MIKIYHLNRGGMEMNQLQDLRHPVSEFVLQKEIKWLQTV